VHPNLWMDPLHWCYLDYVFVSCHYIGSYVIYIIKRWGEFVKLCVISQHLKQTHTYGLISWILRILFNGPQGERL
jgi:hypothetical protein